MLNKYDLKEAEGACSFLLEVYNFIDYVRKDAEKNSFTPHLEDVLELAAKVCYFIRPDSEPHSSDVSSDEEADRFERQNVQCAISRAGYNLPESHERPHEVCVA